jgi:hypothetical protein
MDDEDCFVDAPEAFSDDYAEAEEAPAPPDAFPLHRNV